MPLLGFEACENEVDDNYSSGSLDLPYYSQPSRLTNNIVVEALAVSPVAFAESPRTS